MNERRFYAGELVTTLADRKDVTKGSVGTIVDRWAGNVYGVEDKAGHFDWFFAHHLETTNPLKHQICEGDIVRVITDEQRESGIGAGDLVRVIKAVEQISYYRVLIDDALYWFGWLELAPYL